MSFLIAPFVKYAIVMQLSQHWARVSLAAVVLVALGAAWISFAPLQFGGQSAYVIVSGISMQPTYQRGDLVILHAATDYQVGDIVTYHHPQIGPVIHRLIGRDGDFYIFKGDNNDWIDPYRPTQHELIGKAWIHLPRAGRVIGFLRVPHNMALLVGGTGFILMSTWPEPEKSGARRPWRRSGALKRPLPRVAISDATRDVLWFMLLALVLASLLLAVLAFRRPPTRVVVEEARYQQSGRFSYSAAAPAGIYDTDRAQTGEPIFLQLSNVLAAGFEYRFVSEYPAELQGSYRLVAEVGDLSGWRRTIELHPSSSFSGQTFTVGGELDLRRVQALIEILEQRTGIERLEYQLAIVPQVLIEGTLAAQPVRGDFAPRLGFQLDRHQLRLVRGDPRDGDPLNPTGEGLVTFSRTVPNTLVLLGLVLSVSTARIISAAGLLLGLAALSGLGAWLWRTAQRDEAARIRLKYGPLLVNIDELVLQAGDRIITVPSIDDLARLAQRDGRPILHAQTEGRHCYIVQELETTYIYQQPEQQASQAAQLEAD